MSTDKYGFRESASGVWIPTGSLMFPIERLITASWNPNEQSDKVFKGLVQSIQDDGFLEPVQVAPITAAMRATYLNESHDNGEYWLIVGGAHRKDAAVMLGMAEVPVIVKVDWDEDMVKLRNMRLNMLKGRIRPEKFVKLFEEMKGKGYQEEALKAQMGLVEEKAFKHLIKGVKENLPKSLADQVDDEEVKNTDDLARVLNELFSKHGDTLPFGYMVFDFSGKTNYWIPMTRETKTAMDLASSQCFVEKLDFNSVLTKLLQDKSAVQKAFDAAKAEADVEMDAVFGD